MVGVCFAFFQAIYTTKNSIDSRPDARVPIRVTVTGWTITDGWVDAYTYNYCDSGGDLCSAIAGRKDVKRRAAFVLKTSRLDSHIAAYIISDVFSS